MPVKLTRGHRLDALMSGITELQKRSVWCGVPAANTQREDGVITNAEIGYINEFGSPRQNIPPRPFLNPAVKDNWSKVCALMQPSLTEPGSTKPLHRTGLYVVSQAKLNIREQRGMAPLKPATIRARQRRRKSGQAGDKALLDTASLLQSIHYLIEGGD